MPYCLLTKRMKTESRCVICPKGCWLAPGEVGDCRVRQNQDGTIRCTTYGQPCAIQIDPVEKKPLYHFLPGSPILSIGTAGCNLHCKQCQNWSPSATSKTTRNRKKKLLFATFENCVFLLLQFFPRGKTLLGAPHNFWCHFAPFFSTVASTTTRLQQNMCFHKNHPTVSL